ncbi:helix-turn-helix transcriptional regulator [Streptomyces sp. NPDC006422]|uniref:helix-turn-helix domain-containing protein n=1 Tax=unclassified Streptomyces TaxID=2593676 RepID=UPI0033BC1335
MSSEDGAARAGTDRPEPENHVADRIRMEREVRAWSTAKLAEEMTKAGHPINQSAIWRIESGKPRRRVNLDEALGFCKVFDLDLDELTSPPGRLMNAQVRRLVGEYVEKWNEWRVLGKAQDRIMAELDDYAKAHPDQADMVKIMLMHELDVASDGEFRHHRGSRPKLQSWLGPDRMWPADEAEQPPTQ